MLPSSNGGEIVVDIVGQGFGAGLKYIGDVDLPGAGQGAGGLLKALPVHLLQRLAYLFPPLSWSPMTKLPS